ncbi:S26 family signal peptidase [Nonomuraea sp. NPDC047529]|uniref:S26 family signal peptidase n=1 Tax=Nonomuraea sp. NPDC047529 TaxID=3155623 RepID=UPI0033CCFB80
MRPAFALLTAVGCVLGASAAVAVRLRRRYLVITVAGVSMEPAYRDGDRVLVRRASLDAVRRGQVVLLAGSLTEMWPEMAAEAALTTDPRAPSGRPVNGREPSGRPVAAREPVDEPFRVVKRVAAVPGDPVPHEVASLPDAPGRVVPDGCLVVLGDNAAASRDSRHFGYVPADWLLGVVVRRIAPAPGVRHEDGGRAARAGHAGPPRPPAAS